MNRNMKLAEVEMMVQIKLARFSEEPRLFLYVDEANYIYINKIENSNSIINPFRQAFASSQNDISSAIISENEIITGSSKGLITQWDIGTQKQYQSMKGHISAITSLTAFPSQEYLLITGGMDSQIKLWDTRQRINNFTIRAHTLSVSGLAISPDGKLLTSGSNDGSIKIWDLSTQKLLASFCENDSPITCLQFNPVDKAIAVGSDDGKIRYWDLDQFNLISSTISDKQSIQSIRFCNDGKHLLSAQNFSLKVWDLERDAMLLDYIDCQWKTILDTQVTDEFLYGLTTQNTNSLNLFGSHLKNINFDIRSSIDRQKMRNYSERILQPEINQEFQHRHSVNILKPKNDILVEEKQTHQSIKPTKQLPQIIAYETVDEISQSIQDGVNLSSFVIEECNKPSFKQIDQISEIEKDHSKVIQILKQRMNYMKPILHWWMNNNIKSAINAINQLSEPSILQDAMQLCLSRYKQIPIEQIPQLLDKVKILLDSKYLSHIRSGLLFAFTTLTTYRDDIITIKGFTQLVKVDLSREERVAKYDKIVDQLKTIIQMSKLTKLIDRNKEEISEIAKKLQIEVLGMLKRIQQQ